MIKKTINAIFNEGLIKLPPEIYKWINNNVFKLLDLLNSYPRKDKILFDSMVFHNPYTDIIQSVDIWIINDDKNIKKSEAGFYRAEERGIFLNINFNFQNADFLHDVLVHEFTHAVDPKNNKDNELRWRSEDYKNFKKDPHRSEIEFDGWTNSLITTLKRLIKDKPQLKQEIKDFMKKKIEFPIIPGYRAYQAFISNIMPDENLWQRFVHKLTKYLF